jgi:hypothetical protein
MHDVNADSAPDSPSWSAAPQFCGFLSAAQDHGFMNI